MMKHKRICMISTTSIFIIMFLTSQSIDGYFYKLNPLVKVSMDTFTSARVLNFCHFTMVKVSMDTFTSPSGSFFWTIPMTEWR